MDVRLVSCLEKIFPDGRGADGAAPLLEGLQGESLSFQMAVYNPDDGAAYVWPAVESPLAGCISVRRVECVPVRVERREGEYDAHYIDHAPGLYPDLLCEMNGQALVLPRQQWKALWVEIAVPADCPAGDYPVAVRLKSLQGETWARVETTVHVLGAQLPRQQLMHTEWFHSDCLADYYDVTPWSEKHWEIVEQFVKTAAKRGCTMLLTPHVTPALDTYEGGERTTVQLVDVTVENGEYRFGFDRLHRWIEMGLRCGMEQFEMAHLFTQWGAAHAPKVMALKDGQYQRIFGWDSDAVGGEYTRFLHAYLPRLIEKLREWGVADRTYFHVSDEPNAQQLSSYTAAKQSVEALLAGFPIMDAMSHYEIYQQSGIQQPVVSLAHIQPFLNQRPESLWGYYCCGPLTEYTNRFLQMPLARTRAVGLQCWKYDLKGFLHWGYNFYNTVFSVARVEPHLDVESGGAFPAGDPFVVYPGRDGRPEESIRLMALHQAMQDFRALSLLDQRVGREKALALLDQGGALTLTSFPCSAADFQALRSRINRAIAETIP